MPNDLFHGSLVYLTAEEPETLAQSSSRWFRNTEYAPLLATAPEILWSTHKIKEWIEKDYEKENPEGYFFSIRATVNIFTPAGIFSFKYVCVLKIFFQILPAALKETSL